MRACLSPQFIGFLLFSKRENECSPHNPSFHFFAHEPKQTKYVFTLVVQNQFNSAEQFETIPKQPFGVLPNTKHHALKKKKLYKEKIIIIGDNISTIE